MPGGKGMRAFSSLLWPLLLVSLLLMATVPQGMMRIGGADGMRVVLCTSDGPTEIWLGADGTPIDEPEHEQSAPHCVQVQAADLDAHVHTAVLRDANFIHSVLVRARDQIAARTPPVNQAGPRSPPAFV